jgi:hypothetical protein
MAFNNNGNFVSGAEVKKKSPVGIIAGICAAVIVGGGALAYNFVPVVKNSVRMAVMKPENYFLTVETENLRNTAGNIAENYKKTYDYYNADALGAEIGFSADLAQPYEIYNGLTVDSIGGNLGIVYSTDVVGENILLSVNGTEVCSVDAVIPHSGTEFFMKIAGLSDDFIKMDAEETYGIDLSKVSYPDYSKFEPEKLENALDKYGDIIISYLADNGEISIEKGYEGTSADVSYTYNRIEIVVNDKMLDEAVLKVLEELKNDSDIKDIYNSYAETYSEIEGYEEDDYDTVISDAIESLKSDMETADEDNKGTVAVYVDAEGTVRGHEIYDDEFSMGYSVAKDGNTYGFEFVVDDKNYIKINANENDGAYTGICNIVADNEELNFGINFENLKIENREEGLVSGTLSMDLSSIYESLSDFKVNLAVDGNTQKVNFSIPEYIDDLGIEWSVNKNPEIPSFPDKSISIEEITDEQGEEFIRSIFEKLDWDYDSLFGGYGDYDYEYTDDYNYDYDYTDDYGYDYDNTADYDTDDNSYDYDEVEYRLADAEIKINDTPVLMPESMPEIYNIFANDESGVYEWSENATMAYTYDQSLSAIFSANADSVTDSTPVEYIEYIHTLGQTPSVNISVNGITVGSSVSAVAEAFGLSDINSELERKALSVSEYYLYIYDADNSEYGITLGFENNMVTYIAVDYSEAF